MGLRVLDILGVTNVLGSNKNIILLQRQSAGTGLIVSCVGNITIQYVSGGETKRAYYKNLATENIVLTTDANSTVKLTGRVTLLASGLYTPDDAVDVRKGKSLEILTFASFAGTDIDVRQNKKLKAFGCGNAPALTNIALDNPDLEQLDISYNPALQQIDLSSLKGLQLLHCDSSGLVELDLSAQEQLTGLICNVCPDIAVIKCHADNSDVATAIAQIIQDNTLNAGTVYCNSSDAYYSTIATAASSYGWSIQPLLQ